MNTDKNMERNSLILAGTEVLIKILGISATIIVARFLGPDDFGLLSFAYVTANMFLVLPDFGFNRLTVREVARRENRASRFLQHISAIKGVLYIPALFACITFIFLSFEDWEQRLGIVLLVFVVEIIRQHMVFFCSFFRAIQQMEWEALVRSNLAIFSLLFSVPVLLMGFGLTGLVTVRLVITALCILLAVYLLRRFGLQLGRLSWRYAKRLIGMASPMALFTFFIMVYMQINVLILGVSTNDAEVAFYYVAATIIGPLNIISDAISDSSLPMLSKYWHQKDMEGFQSVIQRAFRYLLLLALPLAAGLIVLAKAGVLLLFGEHYLPSVIALIVLGFSLLPDFLNTVLSATLISMNKEKLTLVGTIIGAAAAVIAGLIFIPMWGAVGAAASWLAAEVAVCIFQLSILRKEFLTPSNSIIALRIAAAASIMGLGVYGMEWAGDFFFPVWKDLILFQVLWLGLDVLMGMLLYAMALLLFGAIKEEEIQQVRALKERVMQKFS